MDFINSLSPARKKSLLAAAILLIIALVIAGFLRLKGSSETDAAASAASGAQSSEEDPQSDIPQSVAKTITPQSGGPANESGSLATDAEAAGQAAFVMNTLWDTYTDPEQARATDLPRRWKSSTRRLSSGRGTAPTPPAHPPSRTCTSSAMTVPETSRSRRASTLPTFASSTTRELR